MVVGQLLAAAAALALDVLDVNSMDAPGLGVALNLQDLVAGGAQQERVRHVLVVAAGPAAGLHRDAHVAVVVHGLGPLPVGERARDSGEKGEIFPTLDASTVSPIFGLPWTPNTICAQLELHVSFLMVSALETQNIKSPRDVQTSLTWKHRNKSLEPSVPRRDDTHNTHDTRLHTCALPSACKPHTSISLIAKRSMWRASIIGLPMVM